MSQCGMDRLPNTSIRMYGGDCNTYNFNGTPKVLLCWDVDRVYENECWT